MKNVPTKIIIHHTAIDGGDAQYSRVNEYHQTKGFPRSSLGSFCGYHYLIERTGNIIKARHENEEGAHTKGQNFSSIGIGLAGNFNEKYPTIEQEAALLDLLEEVTQRWSIAATEIKYHRHFSDTDCPGYKLTNDWIKLKVISFKLGLIKKILIWIKEKIMNPSTR